METHRYQSGPELLAAVGPWLLRHEPEHSLLLGFAMAERPFAGCELALAAFSGATPQAVLVQTAINESIVSVGVGVAARALGRSLAECGTRSRGIVGPSPTADAATSAFAQRAGVATRVERRLRLLRLAGQPRAELAGAQLRSATTRDRPLLTQWAGGFARDTQAPAHASPSEERVTQGIESGRLFVLEADARAVAAASWSRPTANTKTINCVYTPPEERGRGRGRAVTALLAKHLLELGTREVLIFTDADDPTPNRVYARVGFEPIAEFRHWAFEWPAASSSSI